MAILTVNRTPAANKTRLWVVCCERTDVTEQISKSIAQWQLPEVRSVCTESLFSESLLALPSRNIASNTLLGPVQLSTVQPPAERHLLSEAVARTDYAIFVTPYSQPSPHIKISPLNLTEPDYRAEPDYRENDKIADHEHDGNPVTLLSAIHNHHGQSPQSWWLQLPTTEVRARQICPVDEQKSVAQALNQIGIFVRHYRLVNPQKRSAAAKSISNQPKVSAKQLVSSH